MFLISFSFFFILMMHYNMYIFDFDFYFFYFNLPLISVGKVRCMSTNITRPSALLKSFCLLIIASTFLRVSYLLTLKFLTSLLYSNNKITIRFLSRFT